MDGDPQDGFATRAIHVGQHPDPATGAVTVPIYQTSTFAQFAVGGGQTYDYARSGNPTRDALEAVLGALDGGYGLAFASGLAAESTVLQLLNAGDHVVASDDVYGGTYRLLTKVVARHGVEVTFTDTTDLEQVAAAFQPTTRLLWLESPTNPLLKVPDIRALSAVAQAHGVLTVVDNTFASPYVQRPLELGADIVTYSTTKYHSGHSDVISGAVIARDAAIYEQLKFLQNAVGAVPGPFDVFLVQRGIKTLALRMEAHCGNALAVAHFLQRHPAVAQVHYPGLASHPQHGLAQTQLPRFGGMLSFRLKDGLESAKRLVLATRLFTYAVSLGGVESLIELPLLLSHAAGSPRTVPTDLIRLSVGVEDGPDLLADLGQALERAHQPVA